MDTAAVFSESYAEARGKFLAAALGVGHNRRQASGKCELNDTGALGLEQPVRRYNDGLRPLLSQTVECGSEIIGRTGFLDQQRDTASAGGGLNLLHP